MGAGWLLGVGINLVGSILINLGTNVMKLGHNKRAALPEPLSGTKVPVRKIREWQVGVALFSVGNVANFISFGYAAQSLLAAIGCVQFVSNVLFASFVLKEKASAAIIIAISCIVGGCIVLVSFGSHSSRAYTYQDLLALYGKPAYICYMVIGAAVVLAAYAGFWIGQRQVSAKGPRASAVWAAVLPLLYCLFSAIIGTQSVLFSKTLAVLLRATFSGDNQLTKWFTWLVLPAFLFSAVFWVTRLNMGLKMFPVMVIVPTLQICWTLFSILSGMLYFQEYTEMHALHAAMFCLGVTIVFAGVFLLTKASAPAHPQSQPGSPLAVQMAQGAKVAYLHSSLDSTNEDAAGGGLDGSIGTATDSQPDGSSGLLVGRVPDTPGSRQLSFSLASTPSHPEELHTPIEHSEEDDFWEDDEQSLLAVTQGRQRSFSAPSGGRAGSSSSSFSLGRALAGLRLQQLWQGGKAVTDGGSSAAGGVQVLPDAGLAFEQGAAEASARQRRQANQRLRTKVGSVSRRVAADFSLDETAAARLSLGLGDEDMPGISLFAMPMADLYGSPKAATVARRYGALPDRSSGGASEAAQGAAFLQARPHRAGASLLGHGGSMQLGTFGSNGGSSSSRTSIELDDGSLDPSAAAAIRGLNRSSSNREQQRQAERQPAMHAAAAVGGSRGINPLANAIDMSPSAQAAASKAPFDGLSNMFLEVKSNLKELTASIQTHGNNRDYARMRSKDDMFAIVEEDEQGTSGAQAPFNGSFDGSSSQGPKGSQ